MNEKQKNVAVSEVVGTLLLMVIAVTLFSSIYLFVLNLSSNPSDRSPPSATIAGYTSEGQFIYLEHRGGEDLILDTILLLSIGGNESQTTVGVLLDEAAKADGVWNIGERLVVSSIDITDLQVEATIIDPASNTIIMSSVLQEGDIA